MRVPKALNPRIRKQILRKFGVYEKVLPWERTPVSVVPEHIEKPDYVFKSHPEIPGIPEVKDLDQVNGMKTSCNLAASILAKVGSMIHPGITTDAIDKLVHTLTIDLGGYPSPLHYKGYPKSVCTSVNNVAVHGIPDLRPLQDGDIVNVDITIYYKGFHGDCSKTFPVGNVDDRGLQLIRVTEECLDVGIKRCGPDVPFREIGASIQRHAKKNGLTVLPAFVGHGIGTYFHGPPEIHHAKNKYPGLMKPGMTFTIEPALSHGSEHVLLLEDEWTVVTEDSARAAQAEHTVLITDHGADILTK